ncbi:MAG: DUF488 family protein [Candidatus Methanoperedens sp.]|nr:DUF488 family protein [Candidatus Methanoperedens sp.]
MLKETWMNNLTKAKCENQNAAFIEVTRGKGHILSPSKKLLWDYKKGRINWAQYVVRFKHEMNNPACAEEMRRIAEMAKTQDVFLVCFCPPGQNCHRFLLIEMVQKLSQ